MPKQIIRPARTISGSLEVPGDKSISHRYAMLASLAEGPSEITHFSAAADCRSTLDCFSQLGVKVEIQGDRVRIAGLGLEGLRRPKKNLEAGNSGTTMRLLAGILAGQEFRSTLEGDESLRRRPQVQWRGGNLVHQWNCESVNRHVHRFQVVLTGIASLHTNGCEIFR